MTKQDHDNSSEDKEEVGAKLVKQQPTSWPTAALRYTGRLLVWVIATIAVFSLLIYFTPLKDKSRINPIKSAIYSIKSLAANTEVERAHLHISESERITNELKKIKSSRDIDVGQIASFYTMLDHNEVAVKHMLAAEKSGINLKKEGLIKRLCDSLGEQYALRHDLKVSDIPEGDKLKNRVGKGEELKAVFDEIQKQVEEAMHW